MATLDAETLRAAALEMADWLERRRFGATAMPGVSARDATIATEAWAEGYRRAIAELRWAAMEPEEVPDDCRELET